MKSRAAKKILILRGGALGDFVVTLPVLAALRASWPEAHIALAGNATAAELGRCDGLLDAVYSQHEARWSLLYQPDTLSGPFWVWLAGFDLVLSYWPDADRTLASHFPLRPDQLFLSASAHPARNPAAAHYLAALAPLGLSTAENALIHRFCFTAAISPVHRRIALHPGSGSARKNWPRSRWAELCAWLRAKCQAELYIITGEAESPSALPTDGTSLHQLPLPELAGRLASCEFFIGHDSGISHLAASVNVPSLLLFGPTDPACWAPPSPQVQVLQAGQELAAISLEAVQSVLTATLRDRI